MGGRSKPAIEHYRNTKTRLSSRIPIVDLFDPDSKTQLVKACNEFGFFKLTNHGIPTKIITQLEAEALQFFSLSQSQKIKKGVAFGYGNRTIGKNGDEGWIEYLLLNSHVHQFSSPNAKSDEKLRSLVGDYVDAMKKMACGLLELMADGLGIEPRNVFSKLLNDEQSDSVFRMNHYPVCPDARNTIGFGEHTDPQIISVMRSNNASGLEISLRDGRWISVPPDENSFFVNVGDSLQVMTNGKFRSVRHRVVTNGLKSRVSMIYFGGPPLSEKIAPLECLMEEEEESLYREFTWLEFKSSVFNLKLADNKLHLFEKIAAS